MITWRIRLVDQTSNIQRAVNQAAYRNFGHAAASISRDAKGSIKRNRSSSKPGTPPHTRGRNRLRRAIRFAANKEGAVIGPIQSIAADSGAAHEFGGKYRGDEFEDRPFMKPALERNAPRFLAEWRGSIGE